MFSDGPSFYVTSPVYDEKNPRNAEFKDQLLDYSTAEGNLDHAKWRKDAKALMNSAVSIWASKPNPLKLIQNLGYMGQHPEVWIEVDTMQNRPFAVMEEGAFHNFWSGTFTITDWETKLNVMKNLKKHRRVNE